jgi:hypothetical protein
MQGELKAPLVISKGFLHQIPPSANRVKIPDKTEICREYRQKQTIFPLSLFALRKYWG